MNKKVQFPDSCERSVLREFIHEGVESLRSNSVVDEIIRLAIASASRTLRKKESKDLIVLKRSSAHTTPAFEQRLVSLFSE